jgi:hypothetical protein
LTYHRAARRLADKPGRPDRSSLISQEDALRDARRAEERVVEALAELHALDVYCLDPIGGQALIPFVEEDQLAWYVLDLYDSEPLRFWRFQNDPDDTRRPITSRQRGWNETTQAV